MVDNFELIKKLLKFECEGDCYFIQLLRRSKDDPMIDGKPNKQYHGRMHSRSVKDYLIKSVDHLDEVENDIKLMCNALNARAYIRLNKRNFADIDRQCCLAFTNKVVEGHNFNSPYSIMASVIGETVSETKENVSWILDLDEEFVQYEDDLKAIIGENKIIATIPTKSGKHLITHKFDRLHLAEVLEGWRPELVKQVRPDPEFAFDLHKDNPTILYCV